MSDDGQTASYELSSDTDQEAAPAPAKRARNKMTVAPREKAPRRLCNPATVLTVLQTTAIVDVAAVAKRAAAKQKRAERALAVVESHEMGVVGDPVVYQEGAAEYGVPGLGEETTAPLWYPQSASRGKWHVTPVLQLWADQGFLEDIKTCIAVEKRLAPRNRTTECLRCLTVRSHPSRWPVRRRRQIRGLADCQLPCHGSGLQVLELAP